MTPSHFYYTYAMAFDFIVGDAGQPGGGGTSLGYGIRPVINLKADVKISGGIGTINDPFVIETN